jgi:hypothetical protein
MNRIEISNFTAISYKAEKTISCNPTLLLDGLIF